MNILYWIIFWNFDWIPDETELVGGHGGHFQSGSGRFQRLLQRLGLARLQFGEQQLPHFALAFQFQFQNQPREVRQRRRQPNQLGHIPVPAALTRSRHPISDLLAKFTKNEIIQFNSINFNSEARHWLRSALNWITFLIN